MRILIIDGYNVIHRVPELREQMSKSLEAARDALIRHCGAWKSRRGEFSSVHVVFDGDSSVAGARGGMVHGVEVTFTRSKEDADDRIRLLIEDLPPKARYVVVTDDSDLAAGVKVRSGGIMSVAEFWDILKKPRQSSRDGPRDEAKTGLSPEEVSRINEELKRVWGLK